MGELGSDGKKDRRLPRGVKIRGNTLWITFTYRGILCRESLKIPATDRNIEYAKEYRDTIYFDIERGRFDFAKEFPHSTMLSRFGLDNAMKEGETVRERLLDFLDRHEKGRVSESTYKGYLKCTKGTLIPEFGEMLVSEVRPSHIKTWVKKVAKEKARKTVANILIPLGNMYQEIEEDHGILNPVKRVDLGKYFTAKNRAERDTEETRDCDPFSEEEVSALLSVMPEAHHNLIYFALWTGLRTGELIALRWEKIDWVHRTAFIDRSSTYGRESSTKTGERRHIDLLPPAIDALNRQMQLTEGREFVFYDPGRDEPWQDDQAIRKKAWRPYFPLSGVRYRKPYQTRHTFATQMLLAGEAEQWVMRMLGHRNLDMIRRHYGHILPNSKDRSNYIPRQNWGNAVIKKAPLKVVEMGRKKG